MSTKRLYILRTCTAFQWIPGAKGWSCHQRCSIKKVHKNLAKFTGQHLCQSHFFNKVAGFAPPKSNSCISPWIHHQTFCLLNLFFFFFILLSACKKSRKVHDLYLPSCSFTLCKRLEISQLIFCFLFLTGFFRNIGVINRNRAEPRLTC